VNSGRAMEAEIRAEFESSGFSIGGAGPEDAAEILSTRKRARTRPPDPPLLSPSPVLGWRRC